MSGLLVLAVLASLGVWGVLGAHAYRRRFGVGLLPVVVPYGLLIAPALAVALSTRDYALPWAELQVQGDLGIADPAVVRFVVRVTTGALLVISAETFVAALRQPDRLRGFRGVLLVVFVAYWLTNVGSPSLLAVHGSFQHDFLYSLAIGGAIILLEPREVEILIQSVRDSILLLLLASFVVVAIKPGLVLDVAYSRGLLPGIPRFSGLVAHPVLLGGLSVMGIICLWWKPYQLRGMSVAAAVLMLTGLFLAQSKLAWVALPVATVPLLAFGAPRGLHSWGDLRFARLASAFVAGAVGVTLLVLAVSFWTPIGGGVLGSEALGRTLTTLSGRTEIWSLAYEEWARHPVIGYGSELFDADYRYAAGADYLTSGHNQLVDTAARAGIVGVFGLTVYLACLIWGGIRSARVSAGLSMALLFLVLLSAMTESPLRLFGYSPTSLLHFGLLGLVASWGRWGGAREDRAVRRPQGSALDGGWEPTLRTG